MKHIAGIFAAALLLAGCVQQMEQPEEHQSPVFTASFENAATKTYLDSGHKLLWTADDRLSIFINTYNQQYRYTGESGKTSADFEEVKVSGFHSGNTLSTNYAVYPYKPDTEITNDGTITCTLPAVQAYADKSFGLGANTMVAVTSSPDDYFLPFRNLCGYLVVKLYGEGTVKSITIKGNDGEKIAGKATVIAENGNDPQTIMSETATDCITVDCGETGVVLSATSAEAAEFWFCIPPVTFSKGFTVTATDVNGKVFEKGVSSSKTISRNVINPLSALEVSLSSSPAVPEMVDLGLPSGIKWASFNLGASKPEEYGGYYQWGGLEDVTDINIYLDYSNCPYHTGSSYPTGWTKYIPSNKSSYWSGPGDPDNKTVLDPEDDVAHVKLGGKWRMPTKAEFQELIDNCTSEWTTMNGVKGSKFMSNKNDNSIFLPAAGFRSNDYLDNARSDGYYWSSSLDTVYPYRAYSMNFYSDYVYTYNYYRYSGLSVRPVYDENSIPSEDKQFASFTGVIENSGGSTKVSISESDYNIRWSQSDPIIVTNMGKEGNCAYSLQSGAGTHSAFFLASGSPRFTRDDTLVGLFDLPAVDDMTYMWSSNQEYREGDDVYSPMTATRDGDNKLTFRPAGGYIFIQITGTGTVSSIDFSADEAMSGLVCIDGNAELSSYGQGENSIHLNCGEGIELDESNYSTYLKISLLPNEYHNLSITVTGTGGKQVVRQSAITLNIEKGRICFIRIKDVNLTAPEMVDLGLPSGLKWASFNLGATKPEEYGGYYQWGGLENVTDTNINLDWNNCPYHTGLSSSTGWTKYIPSGESSYWSGTGSPDNKTVLDPEDDVAHVTLGGKWRMPTENEFGELIDNCSSEWTTMNGVKGSEFTSKKNGNSIFLPAAGYRYYGYLYYAGSYGGYWSSSLPAEDYPSGACSIYFSSASVTTSSYNRYGGLSVRPVSE